MELELGAVLDVWTDLVGEGNRCVVTWRSSVYLVALTWQVAQNHVHTLDLILLGGNQEYSHDDHLRQQPVHPQTVKATSYSYHLPQTPQVSPQIPRLSPVPLVDNELDDSGNRGVTCVGRVRPQTIVQHTDGLAFLGYN